MQTQLTRRQLLGGALSVTPMIIFGQPFSAQAQPTGEISATPLGKAPLQEIKVLGAAMTTLATYRYPQSRPMTISGAGALRVSISYDDRVFVAAESTMAKSGEAFIPIKLHPDSSAGEVVYLIDVDLDVADSAIESVLPIPLSARKLYPNESIDDPRAMVLRISREGRELFHETWASEPATATAAWGAVLSATWGDVRESDHSSKIVYRYPTAVYCQSVGPAETPVGTEITVTVDPSFVSEFSMVGVATIPRPGADDPPAPELPAGRAEEVAAEPQTWPEADFSTSTLTASGTELRLTVQMLRPLKADELVRIELNSDAPEQASPPSSVAFASISVSPPLVDGSWQRDTGQTAVADITLSGNPRRSAIRKPTT